MRIFIVIVGVAAWWAWRGPETVTEGGRPPEPTPARSAPAEKGLLLGALGKLWAGSPAAEDPAHDPVVHCRLASGDTFLRQSACQLAGGRVDEPSWARLN